MSTDGTRSQRRLWPSLVIVGFVVGYLLIGYTTLDATTRFVPMLAAAVTLLLLLADMLGTLLGRAQQGDDRAEGGGVAMAGVTPMRELTAILLVAAAVAAVYVAGFHIAIPLYLFVSIAYLGGQSIRTALIVSVSTSLVVFLVFELALAYELYRGVLFF